ncbi:hypothetical protein ACIQX3_01010 [Peribacillus frigoritolerans]|uniref:hypothetical protein n=1 Tax=Peribacillus frigoritolerans TaxID=450367 RepID=UPI00381F21A9
MMEKAFTGNIYKADKTAGHSAVFLFQALLFDSDPDPFYKKSKYLQLATIGVINRLRILKKSFGKRKEEGML